MSQRTSTFRQRYHRISFLVPLANFAGALLVFLYFYVINPLPAGDAAVRALPGEAVAVFAAVMAVTIAVANLWAWPQDRLLITWGERLSRGVSPAEAPPEVFRHALNVVPRVTLISLTMWVLAGLIFAPLFPLASGNLSLAVLVRSFLGVVGVGGVVTCAIVYFGTDLIVRRLLPVYFPDGQLRTTRAIRIPVLGRLLIAFLLIGLWPPSLLAAATLHRAYLLPGAPNADAVLTNMTVLVLFILIVGGLASAGMAVFVTHGIVEPLRELQAAMQRVEQNDLDARVPVTTNDELGYLGERFNQMTAGLREREYIRSMFGQYVTRQVADAVLRGDVRLGGDRREVTMLITDLRDFTALAEDMAPEALVTLLNRYFDAMIDAIVEFEGTLDKFVGDAIVTEFNAPLTQNNHPLRAVLTALRMREHLARFNTGQASRGEPVIRMGAGIHTGPAVVGNIGSEGRKVEYTAMGDTVNVASRLESLTKELGANICISAETYARVSGWIECAGPVTTTVKGREHAVTVYTLTGLRPGLELGPQLLEMEWPAPVAHPGTSSSYATRAASQRQGGATGSPG